MKYEIIFGNQGLFSVAPTDATAVWVNEDGGNFYYKLDSGGLHSWDGSWHNCVNVTDDICFSAMRRIIQEPKRWTLEDKKAGRLPEVGAIVVSDGFNEKCEFLGVGMVNGFFVVRLPNGLISINSASSFKPIETPEEKAQREEDAFVDSESFFIDVCTMSGPMKAAYKQGARAAYRKLKGGE